MLESVRVEIARVEMARLEMVKDLRSVHGNLIGALRCAQNDGKAST
jgi:hypothetical protein